jgi:hypothetical protein
MDLQTLFGEGDDSVSYPERERDLPEGW